jgi:hypothetical protein
MGAYADSGVGRQRYQRGKRLTFQVELGTSHLVQHEPSYAQMNALGFHTEQNAGEAGRTTSDLTRRPKNGR